MQRFFKYLKHFNFFIAIYLYITYKLKFIKCVYFIYNKRKVYLRPGETEYLILNQVFSDQEYDSNMQDVKVIVDAGANVGLTSIYFKTKYPESQILCFEPDEENFKYLHSNLKQYENLKMFKYGLWSHNSVLYLNKRSAAYDFYVTEERNIDTVKEIECKSINDILSSNSIDRVDIMKIDIEGAEYEIFKNGNLEWLDKTSCLMIETHDRIKPNSAKTLFNALQDYNYQLEVKGELLKFHNLAKIK